MEEYYLALLDEKLKPALGCTEPIAIALAVATGMAASSDKKLMHLKVIASGNLIKNAMAVAIPGTCEHGIPLAAALGALSYNNAGLGLEVLKEVTPEQIQEAKRIVANNEVEVEMWSGSQLLYIEVQLTTLHDQVKVCVEGGHANITRIEVNGKCLFGDSTVRNVKNVQEDREEELESSLETIMDFIEDVDVNKLGRVEECVALNQRISKEGLAGNYGHQVGKIFADQVRKGKLGDDLVQAAAIAAASGSDARMAGAMFPVMSNSGSGNQGITATMPVLAVGEKLGLSREQILRGVALSNLVAIHVKKNFGVLSALCGATVAATGTACGIAYLLGGNREARLRAINNMLGNVTGMLCDGAKPGCALKVATVSGAAVTAALLAVEGQSVGGDEGIVAEDPEESIVNFCTLSKQSSLSIDPLILEIMVKKSLKQA